MKSAILTRKQVLLFFRIPEWSSFPKFAIFSLRVIPPTINVVKVTVVHIYLDR